MHEIHCHRDDYIAYTYMGFGRMEEIMKRRKSSRKKNSCVNSNVMS